MINFMLVAGGRKSAPDNPINVILNTGQSNADDPSAGFTLPYMVDAGISNPAYYECCFPGQPFRQWYSGGGFAEFMEGTHTPVSINGISKSGTVVTVTLASAEDWIKPNYVLLAGINESQYNTHHYVTSTANPSATITFIVPADWPEPTYTTATAKRSGVKEKFISDLQALASDGSYINIIGFMFMQGVGNAKSATQAEYDRFNSFIVDLKRYMHTSFGTLPNVTIDRNFVISVGLTAQSAASLTEPLALQYVREKQQMACAYKDYAYWAETSDLYRADGTHIFAGEGKKFSDNFGEFRRRQIQAILQKANVGATTGGSFDL